MQSTRAIALGALALAIALVIGAITPMQPRANAGNLQPIFSSAPEHAPVPTPALATAAPVVEQLAAPVVEQLPPPTPQVIYIQLPAAPPPQVIYIQPAAAPVAEEIPAAAPVAEEIPAAAPVAEEIPAAAPNDYQQRRLDAINAGAAYRPRTR